MKVFFLLKHYKYVSKNIILDPIPSLFSVSYNLKYFWIAYKTVSFISSLNILKPHIEINVPGKIK